MKKTILLLFLSVFISFNSYAEWTLVSKTGGGETEFYIDKENIRADGSNRYFWLLMNLKSIEPDRDYKSTLTYIFLDCKIFRSKHLKFLVKPLKMGMGETSQEFDPPDKWYYAQPGTSEEAVYKKVCN